MPLSWTLEGKNKFDQWDILDYRENQPKWKANEKRLFKIDYNKPIYQFRLKVHKTEDNKSFIIQNFYLKSKKLINIKPDAYGGYIEHSKVTLPIYFQTSLHEPRIVSSYKLKVPNYVISDKRMPKEWNILGSNNGVDWKILDYRKINKDWELAEERTFQLQNSKKYNHLAIKILDSGDPTIIRMHAPKYYYKRNTKTQNSC